MYVLFLCGGFFTCHLKPLLHGCQLSVLAVCSIGTHACQCCVRVRAQSPFSVHAGHAFACFLFRSKHTSGYNVNGYSVYISNPLCVSILVFSPDRWQSLWDLEFCFFSPLNSPWSDWSQARFLCVFFAAPLFLLILILPLPPPPRPQALSYHCRSVLIPVLHVYLLRTGGGGCTVVKSQSSRMVVDIDIERESLRIDRGTCLTP